MTKEMVVELGLGFAAAYLIIGFAVWSFIFTHGGFTMPDGKTPAPF